jgi:undecaprenyl-phosphate 4-deoxy-4-formamido-L-arabinose transferase
MVPPARKRPALVSGRSAIRGVRSEDYMSANPIRIGILGCARIAKKSFLPALAKCDRFRLVAVAARERSKAELEANALGCTAEGYESLVERDDIDAVYVPLPVGLHAVWALRALEAGKHVLVEKTFATSLAEAEPLVRLAHERDLVLMEALSYVYHPLFALVHETVASGAIGELRAIEAAFGFPRLPESDIRSDPALGGGGALDALIYPLSFALSFAAGAPWQSISYHTVTNASSRVDERGFVRLDWPRFSASLSYGMGLSYRNTYTVWGETGHLSADRVFSRPPDYDGDLVLVRGQERQAISVPRADAFLGMLQAFADKVEGVDSSKRNEGEDILRRLGVIAEVHRHANAETITLEPALSVVIPVYKSAAVLRETVTTLVERLQAEAPTFEVILVDDGSGDETSAVVDRLEAEFASVQAIHLMRNFGQHNAIMAGLHRARGAATVLMDDDGQHDPAAIAALLQKLNEGADVVYMQYEEKLDSAVKNLGSRLNDALATRLLEKPKDLYLCSFKAFRRPIREAIVRYEGPSPYIDGIIFQVTQNVATVRGRHRATRKEGSTYSFRKLVEHGLNMFTNYSVKPLRSVFLLGMYVGAGSAALLLLFSLLRIFTPRYAPPGWTTIATLVLGFGSLQLICVGLVGEYVGRILLHINRRPQFIERKRGS